MRESPRRGFSKAWTAASLGPEQRGPPRILVNYALAGARLGPGRRVRRGLLVPGRRGENPDDGAQTWIPADSGLPVGGNGTGVAVDPTNARVAYVQRLRLGQHGRGDLQDQRRWRRVGAQATPGPWRETTIARFSIDPNAPSNVLAARSTQIYYSHDAGASWTPATPALAVTSAFVRDAADSQARVGSRLRYALRERGRRPDLRGARHGTRGRFSRCPWRRILRHPTTLYCGVEGGVFRSADSGATWLPHGDLPAARDLVDRRRPVESLATLYVAVATILRACRPTYIRRRRAPIAGRRPDLGALQPRPRSRPEPTKSGSLRDRRGREGSSR